MKHAIIVALSLLLLAGNTARAQVIDAAYTRALHKKFPAVRSELCPSCKLWVNPYFKSVADTIAHRPLVTFYIYTRAHRLAQEALDLPRSGTAAAWSAGDGQPDESKVYSGANQEIGKPSSPFMIAKGHCQAWILLAWCIDAAILSDTYTFNAGMEFQGQNVGTELATEALCRELTGFRKQAVTDSVKIWCGTFGNQHVYRQLSLSVTVPTHYYKIISYRELATGKQVMLCYWMPNQPAEKKALLPGRLVDFQTLVHNLGYNPMIILN
jgi:hypothetical protein